MPIAALGDELFEYPESMGHLVLYAWHKNRIIGSYNLKGHIYPVSFNEYGRTMSWNRKYFPSIKRIPRGGY